MSDRTGASPHDSNGLAAAGPSGAEPARNSGTPAAGAPGVDHTANSGASVLGDMDAAALRTLVEAQHELAQVIGSDLTAAAAWPICLDVALRVSGMDAGGLYLFGDDRTSLDLVWQAGLSAGFVAGAARYPVAAANVQRLLQREPLFLEEIQARGPLRYRQEGLQALAVLPIEHQGTVLGSINVASHTVTQVSKLARFALQMVTAEIGNIAVHLKTTEQLREREQLYRSLVETLNLALCRWLPDTTLLYANEKYRRQFGVKERMEGRKWLDFVPVDRREETASVYDELARYPRVLTYEHEVRLERGGVRVYQWIDTPIYGDDGKVIEFQSVGVDITDRKATEAALRELARTLEDRVLERTAEVQDLYDRAPVGYQSLDGEARLLMVNQTELDWLGYKRSEMIGRPLTDFLPVEASERFVQMFAEFKEQGAIRDVEYEMVRKDGTLLPVMVNSRAVYDGEGRFVSTRATVFDNTERQVAAAALRQANAELARALRIKDEFLSTMSHELRTPLNAILALSEVALAGIYGQMGDRLRAALQNIDTSGRHLLALINDVLDLSKMETGRLDINPEPVNVDEASHASLAFVRELAGKKGQLLAYRSELPGAVVVADPVRLKQLLVNLLTNAVKFTPPGGNVELSVALSGDGHWIELVVQDDGPGIAPEQQSSLFQPFTQLNAGLAREYEGTGLGLALVKRLAEAHGGRVWVESLGVQGLGSRFVVALPYQAAIGERNG